MSADLDAVVGAYLRADPTRTRDGLLQELRGGDRTRLAQAAYDVANADARDGSGMPTSTMPERIAAQHELLERIADEVGSAGAAVEMAREHA